jgi:hypothetical protein
MASEEQILARSPSLVAVWQSVMGFIHSPRPRVTLPDLSAASPVSPRAAPSAAAPRAIEETPAERRGIEVAARYFPWLTYGRRLTLVRVIATMTEHPDTPRFEREIRAAYHGAPDAASEVNVTEGRS